MHSYNLCTSAYHLNKILVLDSISRPTQNFLVLTFHLCFGFETAIDLDQYTGLVPCVLALCLYVYTVLRYCSALSLAYLPGSSFKLFVLANSCFT